MKKLMTVCFLLMLFTIPSTISAVENSGTEIQGIISKDTSWNETGSPYIIKGNVLVEEGAKLEISEGVEVKFNGNYYIKVKGNVISKGSIGKEIKFLNNTDNIKWNGIELNSRDNIFTYSIISNANRGIVSNGGNTISNTEISNIFSYGYGIYSSGDDKIINTRVKNIYSNNYGISLMGKGGLIDNALVENTTTGVFLNTGNKVVNSVVINASSYGIYAKNNSVIKNNTVEDAYIGINADTSGNVITNNTITKSKTGFHITPYSRNYNIINEVHFNNFIDNDTHIKSVPLEDYSLDFTNNYFGTTNEEEIENKIFEYNDDFNFAKILYKPYLTEPVLKDVTAPGIPSANEVTETSTIVTGTAEAGSTINVKAGTTVLGTVEAGTDEKYSVTIPKQAAGTVLSITATDKAGNVSEAVTVTVKDTTAPALPTLNEVTDQSTSVSGTAETGSTVTIKAGTTVLGMAEVGTDEKYSVSILKQAAGTMLSITAADEAGNVSDEVTVTVKDTTAPVSPTVNEVTDQSTEVTGKAEVGSTVAIKTGTTELRTVEAGAADGTFNVSIPKQAAGTKIAVTASDAAGNVSETTEVTVKDVTAPVSPIVNEVYDNSTEVTGEAEAGSAVKVKVGTTELGTVETETDGTFSIDIPKQAAGIEIIVTAADKAGNVSEAATVIVKKETVTTVYKQLETKINVNPHYDFTIKFNNDLDEATVTGGNIYVKTNSTLVDGVKVSLNTDKKSIKVEAPAEGYKLGETHVIYVEKAVKSASGKELKQPVKMQFTIVSGSNDTTPPTVKSVKVDKTQVQPGDKLLIQVEAEDSESGISDQNLDRFVQVKRLDGDQYEYIYLTYNATTQKYEGTYTVPDNAVNGEWSIAYIHFEDKMGNEFFTFPVKGSELYQAFTVISENNDTTPPAVKSVKVDKTQVQPGDKVLIQVEAEDSESGISDQNLDRFVQVKRLGGDQYEYIYLTYNSTTQKYEGTYTVPDNAVNGEWSIAYIHFEDKAGNEFFTFPAKGSELYQAFTILSENNDTTPPAVKSVKVDKTQVQPGDQVLIQVEAEDSESGISDQNLDRFVQVKRLGGDQYEYIYLTYNATTQKYEGTYTVPDNAVNGEWSIAYIHFEDKAGNEFFTFPAKGSELYQVFTILSES